MIVVMCADHVGRSSYYDRELSPLPLIPLL